MLAGVKAAGDKTVVNGSVKRILTLQSDRFFRHADQEAIRYSIERDNARTSLLEPSPVHARRSPGWFGHRDGTCLSQTESADGRDRGAAEDSRTRHAAD